MNNQKAKNALERITIGQVKDASDRAITALCKGLLYELANRDLIKASEYYQVQQAIDLCDKARARLPKEA